MFSAALVLEIVFSIHFLHRHFKKNHKHTAFDSKQNNFFLTNRHVMFRISYHLTIPEVNTSMIQKYNLIDNSVNNINTKATIDF